MQKPTVHKEIFVRSGVLAGVYVCSKISRMRRLALPSP